MSGVNETAPHAVEIRLGADDASVVRRAPAVLVLGGAEQRIEAVLTALASVGRSAPDAADLLEAARSGDDGASSGALVLDTGDEIVVVVVPGASVDVHATADPPTRSTPAIPGAPAASGFPPPSLPPPPSDPAGAPEPLPASASASFVNVLATPVAPDEIPAPLPIGADVDPVESEVVRVRGVACGVGHVNRLDARYCSSCGRRLQQTVQLTEGPRPPLGTLIFDDGAAYGLDHGYVIGRDPSADPAVAARRSHPLVLDDPERAISRVHAEIRLDGWEVVVVDRHSANGTYVFAPGASEWSRLQPDVPVTLGDGWSVAVGRRTFLFQPR